MDKSQLITIVVTAAVTAAITVTVTTFTGWLISLTKALPANEKAARIIKKAFTMVNAMIVVSALLLAFQIWDLRFHLRETGPLTRFVVLRLIVASGGVSVWFLSLILYISIAIISYLNRKNH